MDERNAMDDWDDQIAERFSGLERLRPPDTWAGIEGRRWGAAGSRSSSRRVPLVATVCLFAAAVILMVAALVFRTGADDVVMVAPDPSPLTTADRPSVPAGDGLACGLPALMELLDGTSWFTADSIDVVSEPGERIPRAAVRGIDWVAGAVTVVEGGEVLMSMDADSLAAAIGADARFAVQSPVPVVPLALAVEGDRIVLFDPPCAGVEATLDSARLSLGLSATELADLLTTPEGRARIVATGDPAESATNDPRDALEITITSTVRRDGQMRVEFDLAYNGEGEEILPRWFVLEPSTDVPARDGFVDGSVFGCLPAEGDLARLKVGYSVSGAFADPIECLDPPDDELIDLSTYRLVPGARSSVIWTFAAPVPGSYRLRFAGWASEYVPLDLGFTPLGIDELPPGYSLRWARYEDDGGELYGMVRYSGPAGSPDLVLFLRPRGSGWLTAVPADRRTWTVDGRLVVDDSLGEGGCSRDMCSVSTDWDDGTNMSLSWEAQEGADGTFVLPESATAEALVALVPSLSDDAIGALEIVEGPLADG